MNNILGTVYSVRNDFLTNYQYMKIRPATLTYVFDSQQGGTGANLPFVFQYNSNTGGGVKIVPTADSGTGQPELILTGFASGASSIGTTSGFDRTLNLTNSGAGGLLVTIKTNLTVPTVYGSSSASGTLTLSGTSNATKGQVIFGASGTSVFDETTNRFGFVTSAPTHSATFGSGSTGIALYNTSDQTVNYERATMQWNSNIFKIDSNQLGTGTIRNLQIGVSGNQILTFGSTTNNAKIEGTYTTGSLANGYYMGGTNTLSSGTHNAFVVAPTITQSSTAGYTALLVNPTESSTGSGTKLLLDLQVGGSSKFKVDNTGTHTLADAANIVVGTSTGTKIGTATSQKLGFYNATPVVQQTGSVITGLNALGLFTGATITAGDVTLANLTATDTTLTFSGTYNGSTARTIGLNLGNANIWTALQTISLAGLPLSISNTTDSASLQVLKIVGARATPAANDEIYQSFYLNSSTGVSREMARIGTLATSVTNGSEGSRIDFSTIVSGTLASRINLTSSALRPTSNGAVDLGTGSNTWGRAFLKSGGVINWNNGNVTITHSAGQLALSDATNLAFGTTTGTKIGAATSQKIGFWNATPIVQPTTAVAAATFVANTSGIADDTATFDGYTIGQVVKALRNAGLLA